VSVSQFQMAVAMCVIANGGRLMRPMLISRIETPQGRVLQRFQPQFIRCVVSPQTARLIIEALEAVVSPGGTGALAAMDQYTVVAKTGTAQKSDRHGYLKGRYYSSMVGFFPADSPQVVISIALDEPQNGYYAGAVIAPVFRSVAEQAAACLCVPPDKAIKNRGGSLMAQSRPAALQPVGVLPARSVGEIKPAGSVLASLSRR
jgi:cell division protein FtsI/penicillin-binding protein 2